MLSSTLCHVSPRIVLSPVALAVTLCAVACADAAADDDKGIAADDPFAVAFVDAHNEVRTAALPAPEPALSAVSWDRDLSVLAQNWADGCVFEHSQGDTGENLAFHTDTEATPGEIVGLWADEVSGYDYATNSCSAEPCGHYTQIVWRDTKRIGCAQTQCDAVDAIEGSPAGLLFVCEYDPPGNYIGERPY